MRSKADGGRLRFIEFRQPTLVEVPPEGDSWFHEIKYDGYRTQLLIERGKARAFTLRRCVQRHACDITAAANFLVRNLTQLASSYLRTK